MSRRLAVAVVSPLGVWRYLRDGAKRMETSAQCATVYPTRDDARASAEAYRKACGAARVHICVADLDDPEWSDSYAD